MLLCAQLSKSSAFGILITDVFRLLSPGCISNTVTQQSGQISPGVFFSRVCGMAASWKSGAQGPVKWLCESVID